MNRIFIMGLIALCGTISELTYTQNAQRSMSDQELLNSDLIISIIAGDSHGMRDLIRRGAEVNAPGVSLNSIVSFGTGRGYTDCIDSLAKWASAEPFYMYISPDSPMSALDWAVRSNNVDCVKILIEAKAHVNVHDVEADPLLRAATWGHIDCLKALIEAKADVTICYRGKYTALIIAATHGHADCVKALIEAKANINAKSNDGKIALHWASLNDRSTCVQALIEAKADINSRDEDGRTALALAAGNGYLDCVKTLIKAKADLNALGKKVSPLGLATRGGHIDCVKALLEASFDANTQSINVSELFSLAASSNNKDCVKALAKYSYWLIPSHRAVNESRTRIYTALLSLFRFAKPHAQGGLNLTDLQNSSLQFEILSCNSELQDDLVTILLDQLKKGREIKPGLLSRSKEAAIAYLFKKLGDIISHISLQWISPSMAEFLDDEKLEENFKALVRQGLEERCEQLKVKSSL